MKACLDILDIEILSIFKAVCHDIDCPSQELPPFHMLLLPTLKLCHYDWKGRKLCPVGAQNQTHSFVFISQLACLVLLCLVLVNWTRSLVLHCLVLVNWSHSFVLFTLNIHMHRILNPNLGNNSSIIAIFTYIQRIHARISLKKP